MYNHVDTDEIYRELLIIHVLVGPKFSEPHLKTQTIIVSHSECSASCLPHLQWLVLVKEELLMKKVSSITLLFFWRLLPISNSEEWYQSKNRVSWVGKLINRISLGSCPYGWSWSSRSLEKRARLTWDRNNKDPTYFSRYFSSWNV